MHNPYAPPGPGDFQQQPMMGVRPPRGGCLTWFLVVIMAVNPITALVYFMGSDFIRQAIPTAPPWALPTLGVMCVANTVFALGVWNWWRWGVIGFCAMAAVALVINFTIGVPAQQSLMGLGGPIMLVMLVRPLWPYFR